MCIDFGQTISTVGGWSCDGRARHLFLFIFSFLWSTCSAKWQANGGGGRGGGGTLMVESGSDGAGGSSGGGGGSSKLFLVRVHEPPPPLMANCNAFKLNSAASPACSALSTLFMFDICLIIKTTFMSDRDGDYDKLRFAFGWLMTCTAAAW